MKIILYNPKTRAWSEFIESLHGIKSPQRDELILKHIEEIGSEITPKEFHDNSYKYTYWDSEIRYKFIGEPKTPLEKILVFVYSSASYIHMKKSFPEDFVESRTDWDDMVDYADNMADFIQEIMDDLCAQS